MCLLSLSFFLTCFFAASLTYEKWLSRCVCVSVCAWVCAYVSCVCISPMMQLQGWGRHAPQIWWTPAIKGRKTCDRYAAKNTLILPSYTIVLPSIPPFLVPFLPTFYALTPNCHFCLENCNFPIHDQLNFFCWNMKRVWLKQTSLWHHNNNIFLDAPI